MSTTKDRRTQDQGGIVFCRYRRVKNSDKVLDAHDYGYTAWPIRRRRG